MSETVKASVVEFTLEAKAGTIDSFRVNIGGQSVIDASGEKKRTWKGKVAKGTPYTVIVRGEGQARFHLKIDFPETPDFEDTIKLRRGGITIVGNI